MSSPDQTLRPAALLLNHEPGFWPLFLASLTPEARAEMLRLEDERRESEKRAAREHHERNERARRERMDDWPGYGPPQGVTPMGHGVHPQNEPGHGYWRWPQPVRHQPAVGEIVRCRTYMAALGSYFDSAAIYQGDGVSAFISEGPPRIGNYGSGDTLPMPAEEQAAWRALYQAQEAWRAREAQLETGRL